MSGRTRSDRHGGGGLLPSSRLRTFLVVQGALLLCAALTLTASAGPTASTAFRADATNAFELFDANAEGHDSVNAYLLSHLSRYAYLEPHDTEQDGATEEHNFEERFTDHATGLGLTEVAYITHLPTDTELVVAENDDAIFVVFRGSEVPGTYEDGSIKDLENLIDWGVNVTAVRHEETGIHLGFHTAASSVYPAVKERVDGAVTNGKKVWITGHSLGGALAATTAWLLHVDEVPVQGMTNFGAPRVFTSPDAADAFDEAFGARAQRWVNNEDPVPHVPPTQLPLLDVAYRHVGAVNNIVSDDGTCSVVLDDEEDERLGLRFDDHGIALYAARLHAHIPADALPGDSATHLPEPSITDQAEIDSCPVGAIRRTLTATLVTGDEEATLDLSAGDLDWKTALLALAGLTGDELTVRSDALEALGALGALGLGDIRVTVDFGARTLTITTEGAPAIRSGTKAAALTLTASWPEANQLVPIVGLELDASGADGSGLWTVGDLFALGLGGEVSDGGLASGVGLKDLNLAFQWVPDTDGDGDASWFDVTATVDLGVELAVLISVNPTTDHQGSPVTLYALCTSEAKLSDLLGVTGSAGDLVLPGVTLASVQPSGTQVEAADLRDGIPRAFLEGCALPGGGGNDDEDEDESRVGSFPEGTTFSEQISLAAQIPLGQLGGARAALGLDEDAVVTFDGKLAVTLRLFEDASLTVDELRLAATLPEMSLSHLIPVDWLTVNDVELSLGLHVQGQSLEISASLGAEVTLVDQTFVLEADLEIDDDDYSLEITLGHTGEVSLIELLDTVLSKVSGGLSLPQDVFGVSISDIGISLRISSDELAVAATGTASIALGDSGLDVTLLGGMRRVGGTFAGYVAAAPSGTVALNDLLTGLPDLEFTLPDALLVLGSHQLELRSQPDGPGQHVLPVEDDVFRSVYCMGDGAGGAGSCDYTAVVPAGVGITAGIDLPDVLTDALQPLGLDHEKRTIISGSAPIFGNLGDLSVNLRVALPVVGPSRASPEWFDGAELALTLAASPGDLAISFGIEGSLSLKLEKPDVLGFDPNDDSDPEPIADGRTVGDACAEGTGVIRRSWQAGGEAAELRCYDLLTIDAGATVTLSAVPPRAGIEITGTLSTPPSGWVAPFGIDFLTIHSGEILINVTIGAEGLGLGLGFAVEVEVGPVQMSASIAFGVTVTPAPPFVVPRFDGMRITSAEGVESDDIIEMVGRLTNTALAAGDVPLANVALRNIDLMVSFVDEPRLCLFPGFVFTADLYIIDEDSPAGPEPTGGCPAPPAGERPSTDDGHPCLTPEGKAAGCVASVAAQIDGNGIFLRGALAALTIGPLELDDLEIDLELTTSRQRFRFAGGATVWVERDARYFVTGQLVLDLRIEDGAAKFLVQGFGSVFGEVVQGQPQGLFDIYIDASAALTLDNPEFSFRLVFLSDFGQRFNQALQPITQPIANFILAADDYLQNLDGLGLEALIRQLKEQLVAGKAEASVITVVTAAESLAAFVDKHFDGALGAFLNGYGFVPGLCALLEIDYVDRCTLNDLGTWVAEELTKALVGMLPGDHLPGDPGNIQDVAEALKSLSVPLRVDCFELSASFATGGAAGPTASFGVAIDALLLGFSINGGFELSFAPFAGEGDDFLELFASLFTLEAKDECRGLSADEVWDLQYVATVDEEDGHYVEGDEVLLTIDVEGDHKPEGVNIRIDWADGTQEQLTVDLPHTARHLYPDDDPSGFAGATMPIALRVLGDDGSIEFDTVVSVFVDNADPVVDSLSVESDGVTGTASSPLSIDENAVVTLSGSFTDLGVDDTHEVVIEWGDTHVTHLGKDDLACAVVNRERSCTFSTDHQFLDDLPHFTTPAHYEIQVRVVDDDTGVGQAVVPVIVHDLPPEQDSISITPLLEDGEVIEEGAEVTYEISFRDPGTLDQHVVTIDWGEKVGDEIVDTYRIGSFCVPFRGISSFQRVISGLDDDSWLGFGELVLPPHPPCIFAEPGAMALIACPEGDEPRSCTQDPRFAEATWVESELSEDLVTRTMRVTHTYVDDDPTATSHDDYDITVTIENDDLGSAAAGRAVTVHNVDPTVEELVVTPDRIDEGGTVTLSARFTDPGLRDTFDVDVDWGYRDFDRALSTTVLDHDDLDCGVDAGGLLECTFEVSHTYGDTSVYEGNEHFTITVAVTDDDTGVGTGTTSVRVDNTDPTNELDRSEAVDVQGEPTFLTRIGIPIELRTRATDAGSDDLFAWWDFDDGTGAVGTHPLDPDRPDPAPSPNVDPRDVTDVQIKAWERACLYEPSVVVTDDDGGTSLAERVWVLVFGWADRARAAGWWLSEYMQSDEKTYDEDQLICFLRMVNHMSAVFDEERPLSSLDEAVAVLNPSAPATPRDLLDMDLLGAWLNVSAGVHEYLEVRDLLADIEAVRLDPAATDPQLRSARRAAQGLNR